MTVLFLCINYHNEDDTSAFVNDVLGQDGSEATRAVVIDNSGDGEPHAALRRLAELDERVVTWYPEGNLGYFGAAAWGLKRHLEDNALPDWVVVANTDMAFPRRDFVSRLSTLYGNTPPAVVAPAIYSTVTGADQNPHLVRRPSRARIRSYTWVYRYYPTFVAYSALALVWAKLPRWRNVGRGKRGTAAGYPDEPQTIYAPQGSFIIFNRRYFEGGADLEHGAFLFAEEITVAEKARRHRLDVVYDPRLVVHHHEHATTGLFKNRRMARYQWEASVFCYEEYFR